jgi:hypothetical protein
MKKLNICLSKRCLKKALRTFLQTTIGYVITNITFSLSGVNFADGDVLKNALIGLAIAAIAAGAAAVMNLEKGEIENNEKDIS